MSEEMDGYDRVLRQRSLEAARLGEDNARLRAGLKYYADGCHMILNEPGEWDTVSGEPQNFYCDNAGTATIEDGSIAKKILEGWALPEGDDVDAPMIPPRDTHSASVSQEKP